MEQPEISAAILAGGSAIRFGGVTKPNIEIGGVRVIRRILNVIGDLFPEIIIVTDRPEEFADYPGCKITGDILMETGPIAGIHSALSNTSNDAVFVFAGDMPLLNRRIISGQMSAFLKGSNDILVPSRGRFIEPLHAIYKRKIISEIESFITVRNKRSIKDFIAEADTGFYILPDNESTLRAFTNINSPSDLDRIGGLVD